MSHAAARDIRLSQGKAKQLKSLRAQLMVDKDEDKQKFAKEWAKLIKAGDEAASINAELCEGALCNETTS